MGDHNGRLLVGAIVVGEASRASSMGRRSLLPDASHSRILLLLVKSTCAEHCNMFSKSNMIAQVFVILVSLNFYFNMLVIST